MARRGNGPHHKDFTHNRMTSLLTVISPATLIPTAVPITPKHVSLQKTTKGTRQRAHEETEEVEEAKEDEEGTEETEEQWDKWGQ